MTSASTSYMSTRSTVCQCGRSPRTWPATTQRYTISCRPTSTMATPTGFATIRRRSRCFSSATSAKRGGSISYKLPSQRILGSSTKNERNSRSVTLNNVQTFLRMDTLTTIHSKPSKARPSSTLTSRSRAHSSSVASTMVTSSTWKVTLACHFPPKCRAIQHPMGSKSPNKTSRKWNNRWNW